MAGEQKNREQLLTEIEALQHRVVELESLESERKQAEEALQESEEKYRAIFEQASDSIVIFDLDTLGIVDFNHRTHQNLGYTREEFAKLTTTDIDVLRTDEETMQHRENLRKLGKDSFITKHKTKDGDIKDIQVNTSTLCLNGKTLTVSIWHDITERRHSEEKRRMIIETALDGFSLTDLEGNYLDVNESYCRIVGYTREELLNMSIRDIEVAENAEEIEAHIRKIKKQGSDRFQTRYKRKDGRIADIELCVNYLDMDGGQLFTFIHDVTGRKQREAALRESEEFTSSLLENLPNPVLVINPDTSIEFINPAFESLMGFTRQEMAGRRPPYPWWPQELEKEIGELLKVDLGGNFRKIEERLIRKKNNETAWVTVTVTPIYHDSVLKHLLVSWVDITERKQTELALRESEEKYRVVFEQASDSIALVDQENAEVVDFNDSAHKNLGYSRAEFKGKRIRDFDIFMSNDDVRSRIEDSTPGKTYVIETRHRTKNGEIRDVLIRYKILNIGGKYYSLAVWHDVTELKRAEEALRESEEKYRAIFEQASDSIVLISLDNTKIVDFNDRAHLNLGYTREEFANLNLRDINTREDAAGFKKRMEIAKKKGVSVFETMHRTREGETRHVLVSSRFFNIGDSSYALAVWHDITELKQAEEREKRLQQELYLSSRLASVGQLAAGVAHEINNPLTGIMGFSERLLRNNSCQESRRDLEIIHNEAHRAARVIENLMAFARRRTPKKELIDINDVIGKALELRAYELKAYDIEVITKLAEEIPEITADFGQIQEVFLNIIMNAEQAIREAEVRGKIVIKTSEMSNHAEISFTNNGPVIPAEQLDKIFDPFFTLKGEKGGTGLGLAVCHGIVTEHGGRIYASSSRKEETTFIVELPLVN